MYLLDCASDINSCCNDYGLANILYIVKQVLNVIHIVVPILLMISLVIGLVQLMANPDDKKKQKGLIFRFVSMVVVFFIPYLVNLSLGMVGTYQLESCWNNASSLHEEMQSRKNVYVSTTGKESKPFIVNPDEYDEAEATSGALDFDDYEHLNIYNQTGQYAGRSVCSGGGNTVSATACGLSIYMAARYVLTGEDTDFMAFCHEACNTGLFNGNGSSWGIAVGSNSFYHDKYGIISKGISSNLNTYLSELKEGRVISVLIRNGSRNIEAGGSNATSNGHFILLVNYNSSKDQIYLYNPTGSNTGWNSTDIIQRYVLNCAQGPWNLPQD